MPLFECRHCRRQTSPIAGTVFEGSRTDLRKWFWAAFWMTRDGGITARRLAEKIGVTYKTAWTILHKLRRVMTAADADRKLAGRVRLFDGEYRPHGYRRSGCRPAGYRRDECGTRDGGPVCRAVDGRVPSAGYEPKAARVLIGWSDDGTGKPVQFKLKEIGKTPFDPQWITNPEKEMFISRHVENGASLDIRVGRYLSSKKKEGWLWWEAAREWLRRTFGGIGEKHRQAYWEEFAYRLNATCEGKEPFEELIRIGVRIRRTVYRELVRFGAPGKVEMNTIELSADRRTATA